jgi:Methyltransferase FkbM domain
MQVSESESPTNESIRAVSLSSLCASLGTSAAFDILKVDIEGAEATVFRDAEVLKVLPAVPLVSVEVHDRYQASASKVVADAFSELDFNRSKSGEYLVFTNNAVRQEPVVKRRVHLGVMPAKAPCNISLGSLAVIVGLAFGVWIVMSVVMKQR